MKKSTVCNYHTASPKLMLTNYVDCLKSLNNAEARQRLEEVDDAYPSTFDWLLDAHEVPFYGWLQASDGHGRCPFWIQGKPGSGKSTLMKFAIRNPKTLQALSSFSARWTFSSYFFHDRGSQVQKTLAALLQELLYSVLVQNRSLLRHAMPYYRRLVTHQRTRRVTWDFPSLRASLVDTLAKARSCACLCLFLDALDEHAGENEKLIALIWDMVSAADRNPDYVRLKICLASRPWEIFQKSFSQCPQFTIHKHTRKDIELYTNRRIREAMYTSKPSSAETGLVNQIVRDASGVFIWVRLVMDQITQDIIDGTPFHIIQHKVSQLPSELGELYRMTIQRIKPDYHVETWVMLQVVLNALQPLTVGTLAGIVDNQIQSIRAPGVYDSIGKNSAAPSPAEEQLRWLNSRSGGLLEVTKERRSSTWLHHPDRSVEPRVQFIHQTVRDYLVQARPGYGLALGIEDEHDEFVLKGHEILLRACRSKADWASELLPDALAYAKLAEQSAGQDQDSLKRVADSTWPLLMSYQCTQREAGGLASWIEVASRFGVKAEINAYVLVTLSNLVHSIQRSPDGASPLSVVIDRIPEFGSYLLSLAAIATDLFDSQLNCQVQPGRMIKALIRQGCNVNLKTVVPTNRNILYIPMHKDCPVAPLTVLYFKYSLMMDYMGRKGKSALDIAETLVKNGASVETDVVIGGASLDTDFVRESYRQMPSQTISLLECCVRYGDCSTKWVRFLLAHGATHTTFAPGYSLYQYAFIRNDAETLQILQDHEFEELEMRRTRSHVETVAVFAALSVMVPSGGIAARMAMLLSSTVTDDEHFA